MRWLISLLAVLALAVLLALAGRYDPGYAILVFPPWRIELSFVTFIALLALFFTASHYLLRFIRHTMELPEKVAQQRQRRQQALAQNSFLAAVTALLEKRPQEAEKLAGALFTAPQIGNHARLIAAQAASAARAQPRLDEHLNTLKEGSLALAAWLMEIELRTRESDFGGALHAIGEARKLAPAHTGLSQLELKVRQQTGQWDDVLRLVEGLVRAGALDDTAAGLLRSHAHAEKLLRLSSDDQALLTYWKNLPASERLKPRVAEAGARAFVARGGTQMALNILATALERDWAPALVRAYGQIAGTAPDKQIEHAENWLTQHPRDVDLLTCLGHICARAELWGKAQSYLEASVSLHPTTEAYLALAELEDKLDRPHAACQRLRQALALGHEPA
jgi:HemY protein